MIAVQRHQISPQVVNERRIRSSKEGVMPTILESLRSGSGHVLGTAIDVLQEIAIRGVCTDVPAVDVLPDLRLLALISLSNFKFGAGKEPFSIAIGEDLIKFSPAQKKDFMSVDHWEVAYDTCMMMRDMQGLRFLALVNEQVFEESNNGASPHDLSYYKFMAHFFNGGMETGKLLVAAFEEAMKPQSNPTRTRFVELIRIPILELMEAFVEGDNAKFNASLAVALENHKQYFGSKDNALAVPGWISMRILAACAMAVDAKGFSIEVESEYIPRWLYMGEGIK